MKYGHILHEFRFRVKIPEYYEVNEFEEAYPENNATCFSCVLWNSKQQEKLISRKPTIRVTHRSQNIENTWAFFHLKLI